MDQVFKPKVNRIEPRAVILPKEIKGIVTFAGDDGQREQHPFIIYDVSKKGIGIWTSAIIPVSKEVTVTVSYPYVLQLKAEVRWSMQSDDNGYRCGLLITVNQDKLERLYESFCQMAERLAVYQKE